MITLVQLEYIIAVDTYRHFATAAQNCFVTQPTLSMQIKKMEEHLGVTIFDRSKQPVIPTDVGKKIIEQARLTLRDARKLDEIVKNHQEGVSGKLTVGIIPTLAPYLLHRFINSFVAQFPKVTLEVHEMVRKEIVDKLKKDVLDVGILVTPLYDDDILEKTLFYEEVKVYVHPSHLFSHKPSIALDDLEPEGLWLINQTHCFHHQVQALGNFEEHRTDARAVAYQASTFESVKKMVDLQGGYTLLPEMVLADLAADPAQIRPFEEDVPLREISLVKVRSQAKKRLVRALESHIRRSVEPHMLEKNRGFILEKSLPTAKLIRA